MVRGLENFKEWFEGYADQYIIIGGTACSILMEEDNRLFRATKDIDIILLAEVLTYEFGHRLWEYIKAGEYQHKNKSTGRPQFFRFTNPSSSEFPIMIELFSRRIDSLNLPDDITLTPIPFDDDLSSLSAILVDDNYYNFMQSGKAIIDGVPVLDAAHLIPFKAKAWLDLSARKEAGEPIDNKNIRKHKNDVFRLSILLTPELTVSVTEVIKSDMDSFFSAIINEKVDLKALGIENDNQEEVVEAISRVYYININK